MTDSMRTCERVSDLMDGRLNGGALSQAVAELAGNEAARELWHSYHVVRDVLCSEELAPSIADAGFLGRFQQRLRADMALPAHVEDDFFAPLIVAQGALIEPGVKVQSAANDRFLQWRWVAGLASVAVVAAASWTMVRGSQGSEQQLAQADNSAPSPDLVETSNNGQVMLRDPRLDRLLMAHRQSAGQSALQVPSGFLRSATFEVSNHPDLPN